MDESWGKIYDSMYEGSMCGTGPLAYAVMGYCIASMYRRNGCVILNPIPLAAKIGKVTIEDVQKQIADLCGPDEHSREADESWLKTLEPGLAEAAKKGIRLLRVGQYEYYVVKYTWYKAKAAQESRADYLKFAKQAERDKIKQDLKPYIESTESQQEVNSESFLSQHNKIKSKKQTNYTYPNDFEGFWVIYPKHKAKLDAWGVWKRLNPDRELQQKIIQAVRLQRESTDWIKDGGKYVPLPATWLHGRRWEDECPDVGGKVIESLSTRELTQSEADELYRRTGLDGGSQ